MSAASDASEASDSLSVGSGSDGRSVITAAEVAAAVGGRLIGDGSTVLVGIAPLDRASPSELSFLSHTRYSAWFTRSKAGAVLLAPQFETLEGLPGTRIVVAKPMESLVPLLARFHRVEPRVVGIHPTAVIAASAKLGSGVTVEPNAVIGEDVVVGDRCWIGAGSSLGAGSVLGADVRIHPGATVYPHVELGDRVVIHSGARIGREGFGFVPQDGKPPLRIPHVGRCVLEHDVEVGANSCIDRGSVDDTIVGAGTKIDSLVQIGHNVRIGRMCFFAAQVGIAGSTRIEDGVQLGGQVGLSGHLTIGARATLAAQAGVFGDVPAGEVWSGYPARPHREQLRAQAAVTRLVGLIRPLERLLRREEESANQFGSSDKS